MTNSHSNGYSISYFNLQKAIMRTTYIFLFFAAALLVSCSDSENFIPKPPTYLRTNMPPHTYTKYESNCGFSMDLPPTYKIKNVYDSTGKMLCHKDIDLGNLNGVIHFSYIDMKEPLSTYVNYSNDKVDEHKLKANAINDIRIIRPKDRVFGTFFELQGNVATPFQFYLTDSTDRFVSGVVYFNSVPNYDSLKPSLDYLKVDLKRFIETFKW
jgi:gliding motility-associated lipoprotein GldD